MARTPMQLRTPAFGNGESIPRRHTGDGEDAAPELQWTDAPEGTRSFALLVEDPDAPDGTYTHWVRYDIPAESRELHGDGVGLTGTNDAQQQQWKGPYPPPNHGDHRYFFRLFALDVPSLGLPAGARIDEVRARMDGHVLGSAQLMGRYQRTTG